MTKEPLRIPYLAKKLLGIDKIDHLIQRHPEYDAEQMTIFLLNHFRITYHQVNKNAHIPKTGRMIVVANHPMGLIDPFAVAHLIYQYRKDVCILGTKLLRYIPQFNDRLVVTDNFSQRISKEEYKRLVEIFESDKCIIIFPAGEVSRLTITGIKDGKWSSGFMKLAQRYNVPILPLYVQARNSWRFYLTSLLYRSLATFKLPREVFRAYGKHLNIAVGELYTDHLNLPNDESRNIEDGAKQIKSYIYQLAKVEAIRDEIVKMKRKRLQRSPKVARIKYELADCPVLFEVTPTERVYLVRYKDAPVTVKQITILREFAFRRIAAGSGRKNDFNRYDKYYDHIVLWNDEKEEIMGAYRVFGGLKDRRSWSRLYTSDFLDLKPAFSEIISHGLELGRSFIQPAYQQGRSLFHLFRGISEYANQYQPGARYLFGAISISKDLPIEAQKRILAFYRYYYGQNPKAASYFQVKVGRVPVTKEDEVYYKEFAKRDYEDNLKLLREDLEKMGTSIPPLFRHYTDTFERDGVILVDVGDDEEFSTVDAFMIFDLAKVKPKLRKLYNRPTEE